MPIPVDARKKPAEVKVHVSDGTGVDIAWADGHKSHYDFTYLRDLCPCALCVDERTKKIGVPVSDMANPLQLFKPRAAARSAKSVGNYALHIDFSDGHTAGIYSFDYLRTICPCSECAKVFRFA